MLGVLVLPNVIVFPAKQFVTTGEKMKRAILAIREELGTRIAEFEQRASQLDAQIARLAQQFGPIARERLTTWRDLMASARNRALPERQKLELVNDFMNQTPFKSDKEHWGKEDYWATPIEFLSTNGGDCEDFSIAKYFTLRALGVPDDKLQITYVKEIKVFNEAHMVLAYYPRPDAEPLILDNIDDRVLLASNRQDLAPVYSFNEEDVVLTATGQRTNPQQIRAWRALIDRLNREATL